MYWFKGGQIKGEYEIVKYLQKNPPNKLTFIVLIPTKGLSMKM